ncbi:MAG: GTPase HflX [Butyrivibrio sp.]|nr:GTPase HflX [Butyrivibrio sp.]
MRSVIHENIHETRNARAILVGLNVNKSESEFERSMHELKELTKAIDIDAVCTITQTLPNPDRSTFVGSGKVEEIQSSLDVFDADIIVFNDTLSPMQIRNLEKALDTEVIDRTGLILQIFARRAKTRESRLQVEYAQLQYMLPRLAHMRSSLSRQGGGSGRLSNKGSGEKQLELDRRRIEHRMSELRKELESVERERDTQRGKRIRSGIPRISLVGYTNAGKSTVMNNLLRLYGDNTEEKQVLEKDMLFATLDTSVRKISAPGHRPFLLADTVGFISELPHSLVKAFRSTLEEAKYADILLEIIDFNDHEYRYHMDVTRDTLAEIGAGDIPVLYVFNKSDLVQTDQKENNQLVMEVPKMMDDRIYISAKDDNCLNTLIEFIENKLSDSESEYELMLPYSEGGILGSFNQRGIVRSTEYLPEGIKVIATLGSVDADKYKNYIDVLAK